MLSSADQNIALIKLALIGQFDCLLHNLPSLPFIVRLACMNERSKVLLDLMQRRARSPFPSLAT